MSDIEEELTSCILVLLGLKALLFLSESAIACKSIVELFALQRFDYQ